MAIEIEECRSFVSECETERRDWLDQAKASWREIKKQNRNGKMFSIVSNMSRKRVHYPLWNSTFRIRKPLVYGRTPQIVGQDTAYGDDPIGRTAAICIERLGKGIMNSFPFDDTMELISADMLITNLATGRAYYSCDWKKEKVKEYLQSRQNPETGDIVLFDATGNLVQMSDDILQDDQGIYRMSEQEVDVETEKVFYKHVLYSDFYVDPDATCWEDVKRIAFACDYGEREFKKTFGKAAFDSIPETRIKISDSKRKFIRVYEYWDLYDREVKWYADGCMDFLPTPNTHDKAEKEGYEEKEESDDIYGLENFFPCPEPLVFNAPTDSFYPVTEFYQLFDLIEDVHNIASQIYIITKSIRVRLLFDAGIPGLQKLMNEAGQSDAIGITNLSQALAGSGGDIRACVQYLPIDMLVNSLLSYYQAFQQRLESFWQLSGTSDLLQGKTDQVERTYGEQQMKAKYALNQIEPMQRGFQIYCRNVIELLCEMALKNFKESTLDEYIVPATLDIEDQQRYRAAIALLKDDKKRRFRIDVETDSTIALNEEFEKAARIEVTNALTKAVDFTSQTMERTPVLGPPMIKMVRHLAGGFRQGKQFIDEIQGSFDKAAEQAQQLADAPPPPPPVDAKLEKIKSDQAIAMQRMQVEIGKLQQSAQKLQSDTQKMVSDSQLEWAKFQAENQGLAADRQLEEFQMMLKNKQVNLAAQSEQFSQQMESILTQLEVFKVQGESANKQADNARLSEQNQISLIEALKPNVPDKEIVPLEIPKPSPTIIINQPPASPVNPLLSLGKLI